MITSINMQTSSNTTQTLSLYTEMVLPDVKKDSTANETTCRPQPDLEHIEPTPQNNNRSFRESEKQEPKEISLDVCETECCASTMEQRALQQALQNHSAAAATGAMAGMDAANAKAYQILVEEGSRSAVNHMFTRADGSTRSYSEMRSLYG